MSTSDLILYFGIQVIALAIVVAALLAGGGRTAWTALFFSWTSALGAHLLLFGVGFSWGPVISLAKAVGIGLALALPLLAAAGVIKLLEQHSAGATAQGVGAILIGLVLIAMSPAVELMGICLITRDCL